MDIWLVKPTVDVVQAKNVGRKVRNAANFVDRILPHLFNAGYYYAQY
jgi:hypothetical protein